MGGLQLTGLPTGIWVQEFLEGDLVGSWSWGIKTRDEYLIPSTGFTAASATGVLAEISSPSKDTGFATASTTGPLAETTAPYVARGFAAALRTEGLVEITIQAKTIVRTQNPKSIFSRREETSFCYFTAEQCLSGR